MREYNPAHGFTPAGDQPSWLHEVRRRGGNLGGRLARDDQPAPRLAFAQPTYGSPVRNMRAAEAAAEELPNIEGEELRRQQQRVRELLAAANRQQAEAKPAGLAGSEQMAHPPPSGPRAAGGSKQAQQGSSPHGSQHDGRRQEGYLEGSISSAGHSRQFRELAAGGSRTNRPEPARWPAEIATNRPQEAAGRLASRLKPQPEALASGSASASAWVHAGPPPAAMPVTASTRWPSRARSRRRAQPAQAALARASSGSRSQGASRFPRTLPNTTAPPSRKTGWWTTPPPSASPAATSG